MEYPISGCDSCPMYYMAWQNNPIRLVSKCKYPNANIENIKTELGEGGFVMPITPEFCPLINEPISFSCLNQSGKTKTP